MPFLIIIVVTNAGGSNDAGTTNTGTICCFLYYRYNFFFLEFIVVAAAFIVHLSFSLLSSRRPLLPVPPLPVPLDHHYRHHLSLLPFVGLLLLRRHFTHRY